MLNNFFIQDIPSIGRHEKGNKKVKRYYRAPPKSKASKTPVRLSRRIRGETPEEIVR